MKTIRLVLDIKLRPLTEEELAASGADDFDEDCRPTGDDNDLDEVGAHDLAELVTYAIENAEDMWAGSNLYAAVEAVSVVGAFVPE